MEMTPSFTAKASLCLRGNEVESRTHRVLIHGGQSGFPDIVLHPLFKKVKGVHA